MGKASKKKTEPKVEGDKATTENPMQPEMPEDVRQYKEELEKKTGKKCKFFSGSACVCIVPTLI